MSVRSLLGWLPILPLALVAEIGFAGWIEVLRTRPVNDFDLYYWRARYAVELGWGHVYSASRETLVWTHVPPNGHLANNDPLPLLLLVVPLTLLPLAAAFWIWQAATIASLVASVKLIAPKGRFTFWLIACFGFWPVTWSPLLGQVVPILCLVVAGSYVLLRSGRQVAAGVLLAGIAIKPQLALVVPFALLAAGHRRTFAAWAVAEAALLLACVALIGTGGVQDYAHNLELGLKTPAAFHVDPHQMLSGWLGSGVLGRAAELLAVVLAIAGAYRWRAHGPETAIALGTVGSVLASPFLHVQDLAILFVGLGVYVASPLANGTVKRLAYLSLYTPLAGALALVAEIGWLVGLAARKPPISAEVQWSADVPPLTELHSGPARSQSPAR